MAYDNTCGYIKSGTVKLFKDNSNVIIDYGDGTCDNVATVTTDGVTEEISLNSHDFKEGGDFDKHQKGHGKGHGHGF